jgi:hypothetical protein
MKKLFRGANIDASFGKQTGPPRLILSSDWLMLKKSSPLKHLDQMEPNLAGSIKQFQRGFF